METKITPEMAIEIAKLIDNGFRGKRKVTAIRKKGIYHVNTNECDDVAIVRIYVTDLSQFVRAEYISEEHSGGVTQETQKKINTLLTTTQP